MLPGAAMLNGAGDGEMRACVASRNRRQPQPFCIAALPASPMRLCSVAPPVQVTKAFEEAERNAGPIDVLICNAGLSVPGAGGCRAARNACCFTEHACQKRSLAPPPPPHPGCSIPKIPCWLPCSPIPVPTPGCHPVAPRRAVCGAGCVCV